MVVAVVSMRTVQVSIHQKIDVIPVGDGRVPAFGAVNVFGIVPVGAMIARRGISLAYLDNVLIHMIAVRVVEVAIVQVVLMALMLDRRMAAARAVLMGVILMLVASAHSIPFSLR